MKDAFLVYIHHYKMLRMKPNQNTHKFKPKQPNQKNPSTLLLLHEVVMFSNRLPFTMCLLGIEKYTFNVTILKIYLLPAKHNKV